MPRLTVVHVATSLDGSTTGFRPDVERFYTLAGRWSEDVTLVGADTILAQEPMLAEAPRPGPASDGPLLAVVDSRSRVTEWQALRECGHWRDVVALRAATTSRRADDRPGATSSTRPAELVTGEDRVDLAAAIAQLDGDVVRVDSGGALNGALLRAGLVDEVSLLVHPCLVGSAGRPWHGAASNVRLEPIGVEQLDGGLTWLRYRVVGRTGGDAPGT